MNAIPPCPHTATPRPGAPVWLASLLLLGAGPALNAADNPSPNWPQWRGPQANGVAPQGDPPTRWAEGENVKWKVKLPGNGAGTPIVWGNRVFIQVAIPTGKKPEAAAEPKSAWQGVPASTVFGQAQPPATPPPGEPAPQGGEPPRRRPGGGPGGGGRGRAPAPTEVQQFAMLSIDRATGKTQWQRVVKEEVPHEGHHPDHGFASHSPVTDGRMVYSWFGSHGLHALDMDGAVKWQKDFGRMRSANGFGEGNSPALHAGTLVVNWDHEGEDFIAALDAATGAERWRQARDEKTTWTTPLIIEHDGKPQVIVCASQRVRSYDLATGKQSWECGGMTANVIPTPVSGFGMVYAISGFRGNALLAIRLGGTGDLTDSDSVAWRLGKSTPYVPSPLLYGERLYFLAGNNAMLSCVDAKTGRPAFEAERLQGPSGFYASPVAASGRVYLAGRNGTTLVLKDGDKLDVLATNQLDEKFDASPAVVGRELFLRGHEYLYCIAEK